MGDCRESQCNPRFNIFYELTRWIICLKIVKTVFEYMIQAETDSLNSFTETHLIPLISSIVLPLTPPSRPLYLLDAQCVRKKERQQRSYQRYSFIDNIIWPPTGTVQSSVFDNKFDNNLRETSNKIPGTASHRAGVFYLCL